MARPEKFPEHGTIEAFHKHRNKGETVCDLCRVAGVEWRRRKYREKHPVVIRQMRNGPKGCGTNAKYQVGCRCDDCRLAHRLVNHGIGIETYRALLESQQGRCAICGGDNDGSVREWHIDHDHSCCSGYWGRCGECVRGLLCHHCNLGLGNFKDDPAVLRAACDYLDRAG